MPTYQYVCNACAHEFEVFQEFSAASLSNCPECSADVRKVYSAVGVVFKGSGFYKTDSKNITPATPAPVAASEATPAVKESVGKPIVKETKSATSKKSE